MADPLGSLEKIVKLALRIKEAVDTVHQNKEECRQIRTRAVRVSSLLSRLPETGMTADPAMCDALEDLEESLRRAHTLVAACQETTTVCIYCTAGRQARRLRRVQDDISQKVMLVVFATNIQTTIILTNIQTGQAGRRPSAEQAAGDMIATPVVVPRHRLTARSDRLPSVEMSCGIEIPSGRLKSAELSGNHLPSGEAISSTSNRHNLPLPGEGPRLQKYMASLPPLPSTLPPLPGDFRHGRSKSRTPLPNAKGSFKVVGSKSNNVPERSKSLPSAPCLAAPSTHDLPLQPPPQQDGGSSSGSSPDLALLSTDTWIELGATKRLAARDVVHFASNSSKSNSNRLGLRKFSLSELDAATHHFSVENMVGSGACATVYKGVLQDGLVVAIKKFRNPYVRSAVHIYEPHLVSKLKHKNIVKLIGYGTEVRERAEQLGDTKVGAKEDKETSYFIVEEYMPNGSLNKIINGLQLRWTTRFLLIQGIAQGLCYLHKQNIVHLDVKPSNILLDLDMYPKITDFGIATVLNSKGVDIRSHLGTIAGTLGYMPPEYITNGTLSKKHDVYGFGVTLLEVISGMSRSKRASSQSSIQWAWEVRQAGGMMQLLEPTVFDTPQLKEIERCVEVGLLCTQFDPADRPDMVDALEMLRGKKALRIPVRPGYTKEPASRFGGWSCLRVRL